MGACGYFLILGCLLIDFQNVFSYKFVERNLPRDETSGGGTLLRNTKGRRSVESDEDGGLETADETQTPKLQFDCGDQAFKVSLKPADVDNILIYESEEKQLSLDQLPGYCGVSVKNTRTDVHLLFGYDSCYVKREETEAVLILIWYGIQHSLACPVSPIPPSVVCQNDAMEMTVFGTADKLFVALNGKWAPLLYVAAECWYRLPSNRGEITFSVPYKNCGVNLRDGRFIVDLKSDGKMIALSCPNEPIPDYPDQDSELSEETQTPLQKPGPALPVKQQERDEARSPSLHPRYNLLPKLPSLPGSFNLAVNFPFSLPVPTRPVPPRDYVASTLTQTPALDSGSTQQLASSVEKQKPHVSRGQLEEDLVSPATGASKSQASYVRFPYRVQKPASSSQSEPSPAAEYQSSRVPVPSTSPYQPFGSAQNYKFPSPNPLQVNPSLATIAQYLPPGYFICTYEQPRVLPEMFPPRILSPAQPLQYLKPIYQKPDITQFESANPAAPPMNGYTQQQLPSAVASRPHYSGTQHFQPTPQFQPSQHHPHFHQNGYVHQGSTTTPLSPTSPLFPINLQRRHPSYPAQDARPFNPEYYQKPSGSVQQPWSTSRLPVTGLFQETKPLVQASSQIPQYLKYQTGADFYRGSVVHNAGRGIISESQYDPSLLSRFPIPPSRPEVFSGDFTTQNTGSAILYPRSMAPVPSPQAPVFTGNHPSRSLPPPMPRSFPVNEGAQAAQLPYSQGPSVKSMHDPHPERPSEPSSQKPQILERDVFVSPHYRSTSQEEQPPRKSSRSESYFYSPSVAEVDT